MVGIPSLQSLTGAHSGTGHVGVDWARNFVWELSATHLSKYGLQTGLEIDAAVLTDIDGLNFYIGLLYGGNITLSATPTLNNGAMSRIDGQALTNDYSMDYPSPNFGQGGMTCIDYGEPYFLLDRCIGNSVIGTLNRTQCSQQSGGAGVYTDTVQWPGTYSKVYMCQDTIRNGKAWAVYSNNSTNDTIQLDLWRFTIVSLQGIDVIATKSCTDIDATWTEISVSGICYDNTDDNPIVVFNGRGAGLYENRIVKFHRNTGAILWNAAVPADFGGFSAIQVGDAFQFSDIRNGKIGLFTNSPATVTVYDTSDGSVTNTYTSNLAGIDQSGYYGGQSYSDTLGAIVLNMAFTETAGSPELRNSTPSSFSGWAVLYVDSPAPPPATPRRFLAELGPVRDIQIGPPVPPAPPTNSIGTVGVDIAVSGAGLAGSIGAIGLDMAVDGVGFGGDGVSTGTIGIDIAVSGAGSGGSSGSALITTLSMRNFSGSAETPMWSKVFGLGFPDSDTTGCPLSSGNPTYPQFKFGSTVLTYSMSKAPTYWPSGRLMHATFCLLYGTSVPIGNNSTASITVYQSGNTSLPSASSRALADFSTADLKHLVTGMDNVGPFNGDYVATLLDGISDAFSDNYVWLDGPAGKMWRIRANYKQAGTAEGNLVAYIYCMAMQDNSGNFGGVRFQWCMASPFGDATFARRDWKSFSAATLQTGATVIRNNVTYGRANSAAFTWSSGSNLNAAGNVFEGGTMCRLTTTGALPTGLSTGTTYILGQSTTTYSPPYNTFQLYPTAGGSAITPTGAGSGTHTVTVGIRLSCYSRLFMCGTNAEWDFVQGGGSFAPVTTYVDTNVQTVFSPAYLRSTKLIPPYDLTPAVSPGTAANFYINTIGQYATDIDTGGASPWIGMLPNNYTKHVYTQSKPDEQNVRMTGLTAGQMCASVRVLGNGGTLPAYNRGTNGSGTPYAGMGSTLYWDKMYWPTGSYQWSTVSSQALGNIIGISPGDFTHQPSYTYYPYLITGLPEYLDMQMERTTNGFGQKYYAGNPTVVINSSHYAPKGLSNVGNYGSRNPVLSGTTYYLIEAFDSSARQSAWALRELFYTQSICPQLHPECNAYKTYFTDVASDNVAFIEGCAQALWGVNSYALATGLYTGQIGSFYLDPWQNAMYQSALSQYYGTSGDTKALTLMNAYNTMIANWVNNYGVASVAWFEVLFTSQAQASPAPGPVITTANLLANDVEACLTWSNGSANFTFDVGSGYVPAVNDIIVFPDGDFAASTACVPAPGAFTVMTPYWIKTVSGSGSTRTITLAASLGGVAIVNNDSSTFAHTTTVRPTTPRTAIFSANDSTATPTQVARPCFYSVSRGATLDAAAEALIIGVGGIPAATTGNFASSQQWCFGKTT